MTDPVIPGLDALSKGRPRRITSIPSQAVEALREGFEQALRDAGGGQPSHKDHPHAPPPKPPPGEDVPVDAVAPETYDEHGERLHPPTPPNLPHVDLEG